MSQSQEVNHDKLMDLFGNVFSQISGAMGVDDVLFGRSDWSL